MGRDARIKRERRKSRKAPVVARATIDLLAPCRLINRHLTEGLCEEVFQETRDRERERVWSLYALANFWNHIVLHSPGSITQAIEEAARGEGKVWPVTQGSPQAFLSRCQTLTWKFFATLFQRFAGSVASESKPTFAQEFKKLGRHFSNVWIVDGSRLDAIAHRLKILWDVRSPILPGCLIAFYDLFRGFPRLLGFDPDAARAEMDRVVDALAQVPPGTLLLGDRLYASVKLFEDFTQRGLWGLCRLSHRLKIRKLKRLSRRKVDGGTLEDWLVEVGCGATAPKQQLRYICFKRGTARYELLTNVLHPQKLDSATAIALYPRRWDIERMFYDLKAVLGLHRFYAANPNAVAMQVFAVAMVYAAMRVAQADAATQGKLPPEDLSPKKLFPRVAQSCATLAGVELGYHWTCQQNPGRALKPPVLEGRPEFTVPLDEIRVQERNPHRRKRRFCEGRRRWKSFAHVPGGRKLIR
jgi:transposase